MLKKNLDSGTIMLQFFELKYVKLPNNETYAYREIGSAPQVLLLLHGQLLSSIVFTEMASKLSSTFRVIAPDMRGFGKTTYNTPIISHEYIFDDLKFFIDELKIPRCSVLGWSAGGPIAFHFALKYPENVDNLILYASVGCQGLPFYKSDPITGQQTNDLITLKKDFLDQHGFSAVIVEILKNKNKEALRKVFEKGVTYLKSIDEKVYDTLLDDVILQRNFVELNIANMLWNISDEDNGISPGNGQIKQLKTKTLIIHGDQDEWSPVENVKKWKEYLGDLVKVEILKQCGHNPADTHLEYVVNLLKDLV